MSFLVPVRYPATNGFDIAMESTPASVRTARRVAYAWSRHCRVPADLVDALLLIVSELCTNAILYGSSDTIGARVWMPYVCELRIEVADYTPSPPPSVQHPEGDAESGRGLFLVNALVAAVGGSWGFTRDGTRVWCTLPLPSSKPHISVSARVPQGSRQDPVSPYAHP
ncbi:MULTISPECIES: ATP-binding protein [unclassified Streptomyces]|uniref:ATP-binding protein n=1 Tax=unclassified Streptomyces TaxID=2593676 RepID=UPI0033235644